jgi:hypothetical protein
MGFAEKAGNPNLEEFSGSQLHARVEQVVTPICGHTTGAAYAGCGCGMAGSQ